MEQSRLPTWLAIDERKEPRQPAQVHATLSGRDFTDDQVTLEDFATLGGRVMCERRLTVGQYVTIKLPAFTTIEGWVAWSKPGTFGMDFSNPLRKEVVAHVLSRRAAWPLG